MSPRITPKFGGVYPPGSPMQRLLSEVDSLSEPYNTLFPCFTITPAEVADYLDGEAEGIVADAAKTVDMLLVELRGDLATLLYTTHLNRPDVGDVDHEELACVIREAIDELIPTYGELLAERNRRNSIAESCS